MYKFSAKLFEMNDLWAPSNKIFASVVSCSYLKGATTVSNNTFCWSLCEKEYITDVSDFSAFIFNVEQRVLSVFSVSLMLHRFVWWRVLQFDLLWQSETQCSPKQLKHSCLVLLFSYADGSFHIFYHHLQNAYHYKMHSICEHSLNWSWRGHHLDFIIGFWLGKECCYSIEFYILFICSSL